MRGSMTDSYIQNLFAERIGGSGYGKGTEIYKFEKIKRAKRAALAANPGAELIDMGVGEPDEMAFPDCVEALHTAAKKPGNRGYADNGARAFQDAAARWLKNVCNVEIAKPDEQIIHSIGSKAALTILPACFINPGDVALMTTPGYPVFGTHSKYYGGEVHNLPLLEKNNFLPDLSSIPADKLKRAKSLVINYPNNPTGASATAEFFKEVVAFAKKHNLIVIHDAAYAALVFDGKPLSFLATPGAMDVGVELHSMSKGFNMTGWRLGFVAGNPLIVKAYADVKDNSDSGQFLAIQEASAYALDHPEITQKIAAKYSRRMDGLVAVLNKHGLSARKPRGSFFLYVKAPKSAIGKDGQRAAFEKAEHFSQWMITEKLISTVPWDDAGAYVRFSVTFVAKDEADEKRVLGEIDRRLAGSHFQF
jgi:LL-diaminopimelate aminotransferase